ncbi:MAG TPA: class I SAM-dependent methyltransferase, partial [Polyangiaceae bacterium]|nr:class I SAM-dependent methyltransferase [Polyangiaceae bacterium]
MLGSSDDIARMKRALFDDFPFYMTSIHAVGRIRTASPGRILDLGCGTGRSRPQLERVVPHLEWHGTDIADSNEVLERREIHPRITTYDGVHLPYPDAHFRVVYSHQVFEHVRYPDQLLAEVLRILEPGGHFIGSVAYLEPYHSRSFFNFTPYGMLTVLEDAGFNEVRLAPGNDGIVLIFRSMLRPLARIQPKLFRVRPWLHISDLDRK